MTKIRSSDSSMVDDRRGSGGGGGGGFSFPGMGGGGGGMGFPIKAGGGVLGLLLVLAATFLPRLLNAGSTSQLGGTGSGAVPAEVADGACNSELEQIVCGAEADVQAFWATALPQFYGKDYTGARMELVQGSFDTGCGGATSDVGPFYCPADQQVYIDLVFMQQLEDKLVGTTTDLAEQYIVAHEYGHHVQNLLGINAQVQQASQNDPSKANQYSVALELQADCYAGVWVNSVNARGLLDSTSEIAEALNAAAGVGDDRIQQQTQGRIDKDTWTHGSAEQRQTWFNRGFTTGDPTQCTTVNEVL